MGDEPPAGRPATAGCAAPGPAGPPLDVRRASTLLIVLVVLASGLTMALGFAQKHRCVGPQFSATGQSEPDLGLRITRDVCYTDLQFIWSGRQIYLHAFPYLHGHYDPVSRQISGGTLEYPVLTGLVIHLTGLMSHNDAEFFGWNALVLALCGLVIAFLLVRLVGPRAWWYALAPPLVLYSFLNWDLLAVLSVVGAAGLLVRLDGSRHPAVRLLGGAVLLGVGGALKFYPLMFAAPVALWVGAGRAVDGRAVPGVRPHRRTGVLAGTDRASVRWAWAATVLLVTAAVFALINLPFMVAGFDGWWASFQFQWSRPIDVTTNSIWFWGSRPDGSPENLALQDKLGLLSTVSTAAGLVLALLAGAWRARRLGEYPWLPVAAAMLAAYLLLNKVHSPQYVLWLLPFFVLLRIRAGWILAYFVADAAMGIGFFRWQYLLLQGKPAGIYDSLAAQVVMIGVWGRAALLVGLFCAFIVAPSAIKPRPERSPAAPDGSAERSGGRAEPVGTRSVLSSQGRLAPGQPPGGNFVQPATDGLVRVVADHGGDRVAGDVRQDAGPGPDAVVDHDQADPVEQFRPV